VIDVIKLSNPATREYWEISVLFEDEHLLAVDKPSGLLVSPDRYDPKRPNLMKLLHEGIERKAPWAKSRGLTYLMNAHRLDFHTSGLILLAKNKPALVALANQFGSEKPLKVYVALVRGSSAEDTFSTDAKLSPHPLQVGFMRVDTRNGKRSRTDFTVRERFRDFMLLECRPLTGRTHQIRVHLKSLHFPLVSDGMYGGPPLLLSKLKNDFRLKPGREERALISRVALHAEKITIAHPVTGAATTIEAPWPKDLTVGLKYLRRYGGPNNPTEILPDDPA
jgi:RluA family pseudouridine synthase